MRRVPPWSALARTGRSGRLQTETAIEQLPGVVDLIDEALAAAEEAPGVRPRLQSAAETAKPILDGFRQHLTDVVLPASEGDGRLGADLFARKMRHTMRSETLTPERILDAADREYAAVRGEMVRLAKRLWPTWRPDQPLPDDDGALVRGVLDAIADRTPRRRRPHRLLPRGAARGSRRSARSAT